MERHYIEACFDCGRYFHDETLEPLNGEIVDVAYRSGTVCRECLERDMSLWDTTSDCDDPS